jgi:hypothetical protein
MQRMIKEDEAQPHQEDIVRRDQGRRAAAASGGIVRRKANRVSVRPKPG